MRFSGILSGVLVVLSIAACTKAAPQASQKGTVLSASEQKANALATAGKASEAAEETVRLSELLLAAHAPEAAADQALKAYALDPTNPRVILFHSVLSAFMPFKGIASRIRPVLDSESQAKVDRARERAETKAIKEVSQFGFHARKAGSELKTYFDVQKFLESEALPAIKESSKMMSSIKADTVEAHIKLARFGIPEPESDTKICSDTGAGWICAGKIEDTYELDASDLKILKGSLMAMVESIQLSIAYSAEGYEDMYKQVDKLNDLNLSSRDRANRTTDIIRDHRSLFTLNPRNELDTLIRSGSQVLRDALDLHQLDHELCQNDTRRASSVLFKSVCMTSDAVQHATQGIDALAGPTQIYLFTNKGNKKQTLINLAAFLSKPVSDLKSLMPNEFDEDGQPLEYPDPSVGGLFPNKDYYLYRNYIFQWFGSIAWQNMDLIDISR